MTNHVDVWTNPSIPILTSVSIITNISLHTKTRLMFNLKLLYFILKPMSDRIAV